MGAKHTFVMADNSSATCMQTSILGDIVVECVGVKITRGTNYTMTFELAFFDMAQGTDYTADT